MGITILSTDWIGVGIQYNFASDADHLFIRQGVMIASVTGSPLGSASFNNISLTLAGDLISMAFVEFSGINADVTITRTGTFTSLQAFGANPGLFLSGSDAVFTNYGSLTNSDGIGVLLRGLNGSATNYGDMLAASPMFVFFADGCQVVNGGTITASDRDDAAQDNRYNNAVFVDISLNCSVINLASGVITAAGETGAGVVFSSTTGGGRLANHGSIESFQDYGVRLDGVTLGQALIQVINRGSITGFDGSYHGSVNADRLVNRGQMDGNVLMGDGIDTLNNRMGEIDGDVILGAGDDLLDNRGGLVTGTVFGEAGNDRLGASETWSDIFDGGAGIDTIDYRFGGAVVVALDASFDNAKAAINDALVAVENIFGSRTGADLLRGSNSANLLRGEGGADTLDGAAGADVLIGGRGVDVVTGGLGNDSFAFQNLNQFGDTITDFANVAGNNDLFQITASGFGGGLVAGALAASQFRSRTDNLAQDADDRFIFRTTDHTLWFDADGSGVVVAMMVADLQAGATVMAADILLV